MAGSSIARMQSMATRFGTFPKPGAGVGDDPDAPTLDASVRVGDAGARASTPLRAVDPTDATDVGEVRYHMTALLGRGGMGEVRLCHDRRIGRDVAVKLVLAGADANDARVRARFLREARVQGQLEHPSIVPVYDLEVFGDGSAYFAMKRVRGRTLADILAALRRGDAEAASTFPQRKLLVAFNAVCLALELAHEKGVVHRDIKPANIMLGDFGEVYVLDWGLAKLLAHDDEPSAGAVVAPTGAADATAAGSVLGTPGYMAPEQIDGSRGLIGPTTDVYALGTVLFEILSQRRFIDANDALEATLQTLQGADRHPARRAPPAVAATIAPALDEACARALASAPADRWPSARALHDEVDRYLTGAHDLERRRAQARAHLEAALAHPDSEEGRSAALRELGSAVAIDADNAEAKRALVKLLTTPPAVVPAVVRQRVRDEEPAQLREMARMRAISFLPFGLLVPVALWLGVREPLPFWLCSVGVAVLAPLLNFLLARSPRPRPALEVLAHLVFLAAVTGFMRMAGPLLLLPGALVAFGVQLQFHPRPRFRVGVLAACMLSLVVAFALEVSGAIAPSYTIVADGILIHARMIELSTAALWFLALTSLVTLLAPAFFASRTRTDLAVAEERLRLQAWQLAQIVPPEASPR